MVVGDREYALMRALRAQTCAQHHTSRIGGQTAEAIGANSVQPLIGTMGRSYIGRRSRVRIDERAARANVHAALHIQHRRPNGWADRGPNRYKHSLEKWAEVIGVGARECSLMRALRTQTCAQHHLSSIGARKAAPIEPQIGTQTHWGNGHNLRGSAGAPRAFWAAQPYPASAERKNERVALEYRYGTGRHHRREREVRV
jgi:hypothetical protein